MSIDKSKSRLGDVFKKYESKCEKNLSSDSRWLIRLDGVNFSGLARRLNLEKPYDVKFQNAMHKLCIDLQKRFNLATVYTASDEITCVSSNYDDADENEKPLLYDNRILKLCSVFAGYASSRFYTHLLSEGFSEEVLEASTPVFDARIFAVKDNQEIAHAIRWRQLDCIKNAITLIAESKFGHQELFGVSTGERYKKLTGLDIVVERDYSPSFVYGAFFKKTVKVISGVLPSGEPARALRSESKPYSFEIESIPIEEACKFIVSRLTGEAELVEEVNNARRKSFKKERRLREAS